MAQVPNVDVEFDGDGVTTIFDFNFPYQKETEIFVTVDGVQVPYVWVAGSTASVQVVPAPALGTKVRIYRSTMAYVPLHLFAAGVPFLPRYVDENSKQLLYCLQEGISEFGDALAQSTEALAGVAAAQAAAQAAAASANTAVQNAGRALRIPPEEPVIAPLPLAVQRANKLLGFDSEGRVAMLSAATDSAAQLALDLLSQDPNKGLALIGRAVRQVKSVAELRTIQGSHPGDLAATASYYADYGLPLAKFDSGRGTYSWVADSLAADNGGTVIQPTGVPTGRWFLVIDQFVSLRQFGAYGDGVHDDTEAILRCIAAHPGVHDILSWSTVTPAGWTIYVGVGTYLIGSNPAYPRVLVKKNNVRFLGAGEGNSIWMAPTTRNIAEVCRFLEAYRCEMSNMSIDGGLPFTPTGTENYGADVGLVLDQVAYFRSTNLTVQQCRITACDTTHLWESHFTNLSHLGCGWFGTPDRRGGGWHFTGDRSESNPGTGGFPGAESNQITCDKYSSNCLGTHLSVMAPVFNLRIGKAILEGRTYNREIYALNQPLVRVSGLSEGIDVNMYVYAHEQPFQYGSQLISFENGGQACRFKVNMYKETTLPGHYDPILDIVGTTSAWPLLLDLELQDIGGTTRYFAVSGGASGVEGRIGYRTNVTGKDPATMWGSDTLRRSKVNISAHVGDFTIDRRMRTVVEARTRYMWSPPSGGALYALGVCPAFVQFSGTTLVASKMNNFSTVSRSGVGAGKYRVYWTTPLPANHVVNINIGGVPAAQCPAAVNINEITAEYVDFYVWDRTGNNVDPTIVILNATAT